MDLLSSVQYEIVVTGTYTYVKNEQGVAFGWADAEYSWTTPGQPKLTLGEDFNPNVLDLTIGGCAPTNNTEWGLYQDTHVYKLLRWGADAPISFFICDTFYEDNDGSLQVTIYKKNW